MTQSILVAPDPAVSRSSLEISRAARIDIDSMAWYASGVRSVDMGAGHTGGDHLLLAHVAGAHPAPGELPDIPTERVPIRVHSECIFGDIFNGHRCDCGAQLREALEEITKIGYGIIIYLRQEGRGIGLFDKIRSFLETGDTFERNVAIGRPEDARGYSIVADIVQSLGIRSVNLLSGNPHKARELTEKGISVDLCGSLARIVTAEATCELSAKLRRGYAYQEARR